MKRSYGIWLIALAVFAFTASSVEAQVTANGPYYATPSWDQQLPASTRFIVLSNWGNAAVLDRETGLIWERSPNGTRVTRGAAQHQCNEKAVGNRLGWRLPTVQELASLIDPSLAPNFPPLPSDPIPLPAGHPFTNVQKFFYWSATFDSPSVTGVEQTWVVGFDDGRVTVATSGSGGTGNVWCVRGGQGVDAQPSGLGG